MALVCNKGYGETAATYQILNFGTRLVRNIRTWGGQTTYHDGGITD